MNQALVGGRADTAVRHHFGLPRVAPEIARRSHEDGLAPRHRLGPTHQRHHARPAGAGGARPPRVYHQRDGLRTVDGEVAGDRFRHPAWLRGGRQHVRVGRRERQVQSRRGDREQQHGGSERDRTRAAHHPAREPVPGAALRRSRRPRGVALQAGGRQRVDTGTERDEHGWQHDQRNHAGRQRHERPTDPHRVEEAHRHRQHRGGRAGDRQRAVQHRAPRSPQRARDRRGGVRSRPGSRVRSRPDSTVLSTSCQTSRLSAARTAPRTTRQLLAVAREHEQAVVDPEAQPHAGDEVDGEHRQPEDVVDQAQ